jgi:hypothetical protein
MTTYKVHFDKQDIVVDADEEAEALFIAMSEVECSSIDEEST